MAPALKGKSGSVAATAKGAKGVKAPAAVKSDGPLLPVDPLLVRRPPNSAPPHSTTARA